MLADIQATGDKLGATGFSFSDNEDGTSSVSFGFPDQDEDGSLSVTVTRDFSVPTALADKVRDAMTRNATASGVGVMGDSRRAPSTGAPSKAAPAAESRQGSTFGGTSGAPASASARGSLGNGIGTQSSKSGGGPNGTPGGAAVGSAGGSPTGTASSGEGFASGSSVGSLASKAAAAATAVAEGAREPSVAATSLPGGTMTDAPTVSDTVTRDATVATGQVGDAAGSWENRFGTGRSYYGSDSIRAGADSIKGKPTKDARATAMREARQENPAAFVAATVLAELDPPQLKSLLTDAESQMEARKILDVIANRALLGGTYTKGNGPLGGVMGEAGTITAESLSDAVSAKMQFSPVNLAGDKAAREANQRVMGYLAGDTAQAEMAMVLGMIDQLTSGATTTQSDDTHYLANYMANTKSWSRQMGKGQKVGGHTFKSADGSSDALARARAALTGKAESKGPTGSEIADRIAKAMESEGATRYDKEGNAYYKDKDGDLVDSEGNVVEKATKPKSITEYAREVEDDTFDLDTLHSETDPGRVSAPDLDGLTDDTKQAVVDLQKAWGKQLTIVSGFRGKGRNAKAGGAKRSQHMQGKAVDIRARGMTFAEKSQLIALASSMGFGGIGVYSGGSIHLDTRKSPAMWGDDHTAKSVPKDYRDLKSKHLAGKFKGRTDEFARATETEFSEDNANLPERNPFTAEATRIAQGLKDAPDSSIAPANDNATGFANSIRDAIAKATSDPIGTALGGMTTGGTSTADTGIGPTGAVPAPERNTANDVSAEQAAAADSSAGRQQVDAKDKATAAYDAKVAEIAAKVAEVRAEIEANVTGMPKSDRQIAMSEAERKDQERADKALSAQIAASQAPAGAVPSLALGKVQRGEADTAVAGFEAGKTAPTATADTQFAERDRAPFSLDAELSKPGVLNGRIATATNTKAAVNAGRLAQATGRVAERQGLIAGDVDSQGDLAAASGLQGLSKARSAQAVAQATVAGVKAVAQKSAKAAQALAEAQAKLDAATKGLPATARNVLASRVAQVAQGMPGTYAPDKEGTAQAIADATASFEQGMRYSDPDQVASTGDLTGPAGLTSTPTDPVSGLPVEGMPSDQAIAESSKTVEIGKPAEISKTVMSKIAEIAETAKTKIAETAKKVSNLSLSDVDKARVFSAAVAQITNMSSRGIDELLRREQQKKKEDAAKAQAEAEKVKKGTAKNKAAVDPWMLALAKYMDALQQAA